jgi:hypothetical protein
MNHHPVKLVGTQVLHPSDKALQALALGPRWDLVQLPADRLLTVRRLTLGLALGGRASPDVIRTGQDRAAVTGVFRWAGRSAGCGPWAVWLEDLAKHPRFVQIHTRMRGQFDQRFEDYVSKLLEEK